MADVLKTLRGYSMLDWAMDLIRNHERNRGHKPDSLLLTDGQIYGLAAAIAETDGQGRSLIDIVDSIRRGEAYLMGVPVRLFEVEQPQRHSVAELLDRQRNDHIMWTGREPSELVITNLQEDQLRQEMAPFMFPYRDGEKRADGTYWCGIPVRVIKVWENHGPAQ